MSPRAIAALAFAAAATAAYDARAAEGVADFFRRTPVALYVASGPGGGFDAYARVFAAHFSRHLPGAPNIVIRNMPGATGLVAMNFLANSAPRDGSAILASFNTAVLSALFGDRNARYDPRDMAWLGSIGKQTATCLTWRTSPVRTIDDARRVETLMGATGDGSTPVMFPRLLNSMIGTKFKVITGYSTPGMRLAVESGEVAGICGVAWETHMASVPAWIRDNKVNFLAQLGLSESAHLPGVPKVVDMISNPEDRAVYELLAIAEEFGRPFLAPPGVDPERLAALRKGFAETLDDPAYRADAERAAQFVDPLGPDESAGLVARAYAASGAVLARASEYAAAMTGN